MNTNFFRRNLTLTCFPANAPRRLDKLGASYSSINTRLAGGPPIWITIGSDKFTSAYYVNNAKLLTGQSDIVGIKENKGRRIIQVGGTGLFKMFNTHNCNLAGFAQN